MRCLPNNQDIRSTAIPQLRVATRAAHRKEKPEEYPRPYGLKCHCISSKEGNDARDFLGTDITAIG
jgi:hypothetical protein